MTAMALFLLMFKLCATSVIALVVFHAFSIWARSAGKPSHYFEVAAGFCVLSAAASAVLMILVLLWGLL